MNDDKIIGIERAARYRMYLSFRYAEIDKRNPGDGIVNALYYARWASDLFGIAAILKGLKTNDIGTCNLASPDI